MFKEPVDEETQHKYRRLLDTLDGAAAQRQGITVEQLRQEINKDAEEFIKICTKRKRNTGITKVFHLKFEWNRCRLYFIFQKVATDGNGKMIFSA